MTCVTWKRLAVFVLPALALALIPSGGAQGGLVENGSFESTTNGVGQMGFNTNATGWSTGGYNFIMNPGSGDGANGVDGFVAIAGTPPSSPDGGNFVAADGDFGVGAITQTINGLTVGDTYAVSFYWAASQQADFAGTSTSQWTVGFGSQSQSTSVVGIPQGGFSGWMSETFNFTAGNTSEVLSFLATGTGAPPFSLLDGVSVNDVTAVPEPASLSLMFVGMVGFGAVGLRRRARAKAAAAA